MATPVEQMREACSRAHINRTHISRIVRAYGNEVANIEVDVNGSRPLYKASAVGNIDAIIPLLNCGADINASTLQGRSPLRESITSQTSAVVNLLINRGAKIDMLTLLSLDPSVTACETALSMAVRFENYGAVHALIQAGADLSIGTPLSGAVANENIDMVHVLCQYGASTNVRNSFGNTPLHLAAASANPAIATMLLRNGAYVNATQKGTNITPLHIAAAMSGLVDTEETIKVLLAAGANINARMVCSPFGTARQWSALHVAAADGNSSVYELLLRHGGERHCLERDQFGKAHCMSSGRDKKPYISYMP